MLGAIIGDVVGSRFEFNNTSEVDFALFTSDCDYTDDTICTVAVADALLNHVPYRDSLLAWCRRYPNPKGSYGGSFAHWISSAHPQPYYSYGNGAAMRVSPVAWAFHSSDQVIRQAISTAIVTHNHPEGLIGAAAVAEGILMARTCGKEAVDEVAMRLYGTDYAKHLIPKGVFDVTCQGCVPLCFALIRQSHSFEHAIRLAISYGGDSDTVGAMVGSIAEGLYGIPDGWAEKTMAYLPADMRRVVMEFTKEYMAD